ncbi:MAG TPA: hypothetical protein VFM82_12110 [Flavobacteriaceae bacterium]|nr:hypothetical protein [Flavobacteriaceae bacterium]
MNYILHLNAIFQAFAKDDRLNPTHISLYWALFHFANLHRFPEDFHIDRAEIMRFSKIASKTTYHKCLRELDKWMYIHYFPSHSQYRGSKISLPNFWTTDGQPLDKQWTSGGQPLVHKYKHDTNNNKHEINIKRDRAPKNYFEIFGFLKNLGCLKNFSEEKLKIEARKFFNHYEANGWKIGGKTPMENWKPVAENWILKVEDFKPRKTTIQKNNPEDHLHTERSKNYNQPL